jgi:hypothetical protein
MATCTLMTFCRIKALITRPEVERPYKCGAYSTLETVGGPILEGSCQFLRRHDSTPKSLPDHERPTQRIGTWWQA